jgi:hypothetical protein
LEYTPFYKICKQFRLEKRVKKGELPLQPTKFGDQSILRSVDFRLEERIISGVRRG